MAGMLLDEMIRIAKERKLDSMQAYVLAANKPMLSVFERGGFKRLPSEEPGEVLLKLELNEDAD